MRKSTFDEFAEVASKEYNSSAKKALEELLGQIAKENSTESIRQLGLPQVLMFLSSVIAKENKNKIILEEDVREAFSFLQFLLERELNDNLLENDSINLGLPFAPKRANRLNYLLQIKGNMKTKTNLEAKVTRLTDFLKNQQLAQKHITRIITEIKATILLIARLICFERAKSQLPAVQTRDIDFAYDFVRYLILRLDLTKIKILHALFSVQTREIWAKFLRIVFDSTAHDHLSGTAYADWENNLPESFVAVKKYINCGSRPYISAIFGFCEIYCAQKKLTKVTSEELTFILEDFEKAVFGDIHPLILESRGVDLSFTRDSLDLLKHISDWLTAFLIRVFGKDRFVFDFATTIPHQISLLLFLAIVAMVKSEEEKIDATHVLTAVKKWVALLHLLGAVPA